MRTKKIMFLSSVVLIVFILVACGVSKKEYLKSQEQVQTLTKNKQELSNKATALEQENKRLLDALDATKSEKSKMIADLTKQKQELEKEKEEVAKEKEVKISELNETYDKLTKELKSEVKLGEVKITQLQDKLSVKLVEKILFKSGQAEIKKEGLAILSKVGDILKKVEGKGIRIEGHTDNVPIGPDLKSKYPSNWHLSTARAINVAIYLQYGVGIAPEFLSVAGYSSYRPIAENKTVQGRAHNRRIEIVLVPMGIERVVEEK